MHLKSLSDKMATTDAMTVTRLHYQERSALRCYQERSAFRRYYDILLECFGPKDIIKIAAKLYSKSIITKEEKEDIMKKKTSIALMDALERAINRTPKAFNTFLDILKEEEPYLDLVKQLEEAVRGDASKQDENMKVSKSTQTVRVEEIHNETAVPPGQQMKLSDSKYDTEVKVGILPQIPELIETEKHVLLDEVDDVSSSYPLAKRPKLLPIPSVLECVPSQNVHLQDQKSSTSPRKFTSSPGLHEGFSCLSLTNCLFSFLPRLYESLWQHVPTHQPLLTHHLHHHHPVIIQTDTRGQDNMQEPTVTMQRAVTPQRMSQS